MSNFFNITNFDKKIKAAFEGFCSLNQLSLYVGGGVSIYVGEDINPPYYLQKMNKIVYAVLTQDSMVQKNSAWSNLRIPLEHEASLFKSLYEKLLYQEEKDVFYKYVTNFISPLVVAQHLRQDLDQLELFLKSAKNKKSKSWLVHNILEYISPLMSGRSEEDKSKLLDKILRNNIYTNDLEQKNKLFKFINIHISSEYKESLAYHYGDIKNSKENTLFNYPSNTLIIDLNKVALASCFSVDLKVNDTYINNFFNNFQYLVMRKESKNILNIQSCEISQKTQAYKNYRITISSEENKNLNKNMIENYIKSFIDIYSNGNYNDKKLLNEINQKIVLNLVLSDKLPEKSVNVSRKKI